MVKEENSVEDVKMEDVEDKFVMDLFVKLNLFLVLVEIFVKKGLVVKFVVLVVGGVFKEFAYDVIRFRVVRYLE